MKRSFLNGLSVCLFVVNMPAHANSTLYKKQVDQKNLTETSSVDDLIRQILDLPPEEQLKAQRILNDYLKKLDAFYVQIEASPELNLAYRKLLNTKLKQLGTITQSPKGMTPEEELIYLRSVNKQLREKSIKERRAIVETVNKQLADAYRQSMSLKTPLKSIPVPPGHAGMLKMASFTPLEIPAAPEIPILGSTALDSYDLPGSNDGIPGDLVRDIAKEGRDFESRAASSQDVLNSDIKDANRASRSATNVIEITPTETADFLQAKRDKRRLALEGLKG
jgi:hypothetical protein